MEPGWVLITGASEGMGYEFAKIFARKGHSLVLVARNRTRLEAVSQELSALYGTETKILPQDLSTPDAAATLIAEIDRQNIRIEILVNNAGCGVYGFFHETDWTATEAMLTLNMITATQLTRLMLPSMIQNGHGRILNVASTAAFQPGPLMACYFASKAYLLSFTEALANELSGTSVTATAFCPGPTRTQFQKRSHTENIRENFFAMDAASAVAAAYRGLMKGKRLVIPGLMNNLLAILVRLFPRKMILDITRFLEEPK